MTVGQLPKSTNGLSFASQLVILTSLSFFREDTVFCSKAVFYWKLLHNSTMPSPLSGIGITPTLPFCGMLLILSYHFDFSHDFVQPTSYFPSTLLSMELNLKLRCQTKIWPMSESVEEGSSASSPPTDGNIAVLCISHLVAFPGIIVASLALEVGMSLLC